MNEIFISYRRKDKAADTVGRLYDALASRFGHEHVFRDKSNLGIGRWDQSIEKALGECKKLVAVIGPDWLESDRLHDPDDLVRHEISFALQHKKTVIPVLVHGTKMPNASALPDDLQDFSLWQATELHDDPNWDPCINRLIKSLENDVETEETVEKGPVHKAVAKVKHDYKATTPVSALERFGSEVNPSFRLERGQQRLQFSGSECTLNRHMLDPDDASISAKAQARIEHQNDEWYITDLSSNQTSFMQIRGSMRITDGDVLILGERAFVFEPDTSPRSHKSTSPISDSEPSFRLLRKRDQQNLEFKGNEVILNREMLDRDNDSISSRGHARFECKEGQWYINDLSSNHASFVQIRGTMRIQDEDMIILGQKLYTFASN